MRPVSEIRYLVFFIPAANHILDKTAAWIEEGLTVDEIHRMCKARCLRADLFHEGDIARMKRLVIIPPAGLDTGILYQLSIKERDREIEASRLTGWDHLLRDDFD